MARAEFAGKTIAESDDVAVVDGFTYFPLDAVDPGHLRRSDHTTTCHWKGQATYHDVVVDGAVAHNAAWEYREPSAEAEKAGVKGRIAFWKDVHVR